MRVWIAMVLACAVMDQALAEPVADEVGVRAAENAWSAAFLTGDTDVLNALLDADYVSVGTNGAARPKSKILHISAAYAKAHPGARASPLSPTSTIRVIGNSALVAHHSDNENSVDLFYFKDGRWHAWYSQHTARAN